MKKKYIASLVVGAMLMVSGFGIAATHLTPNYDPYDALFFISAAMAGTGILITLASTMLLFERKRILK